MLWLCRPLDRLVQSLVLHSDCGKIREPGPDDAVCDDCTQALTAALVFKMLDADESGHIDADELEETVASIFTGELDKKVRCAQAELFPAPCSSPCWEA